MFDVVGFGALNMDQLYMVDRIIGPEEETIIRSFKESCGGSAANTIIGLSKLGLKTAYIGKVAMDREGVKLKENLEREKVNLDLLIITKEGRSGKVIGFVDENGQRALYLDPGVNDTIKIDEIKIELVENSKLLHLTSFAGEGLKVQETLLERLSSRPLISLDPGNLYAKRGIKSLRRLIEAVNVLLLNEMEIKVMLGYRGSYKEAAKLLADEVDIIIIKRGSLGVYGLMDDLEVEVPALKVECVDTTGAGDAFNAGFLYAWLMGHDLKTSCYFGNYIASHCIQGYGATTTLPSSEATRILKK
ncbi:carbohydrate kinase family protein [Methanothermobacter tenebrarum]|uniref:Carbohydrate kinase family protein n=1 Tax=Methanothermobacter tenebrarum TaxID=680118 RepID=A0A328PHW1_9EURY|nr:carbohydrate kinase family protein [Methanothermobacter tenebrarum]MBC7100994.1 carbohydrate kinase family protein [Methanobacteriales archaeon]MBC7117432.1 carbohydrate kinase family protein [Methanobacteriaceae archaeon]NPV64690.1 carbohydrate kinase family protein [Methanobacteriaceae archaeon]RAO79024.1 carbohydrate kinase family protein [Methanothermobacter tenebrarum]